MLHKRCIFPPYFFPASPASKNNTSDAALFTVLAPTCTPIMFRAQLGHIAFTGISFLCLHSSCSCSIFFKVKLNATKEIMFCHGNEKATSHFSLLIALVAPEDILCSQYKRSPMYIRRVMRTIIVNDWRYLFKSLDYEPDTLPGTSYG